MTNEFPSNSRSNPGQQPEKKVDKKVDRVTTGTVVKRKKSWGKRLTERFTGGEDVASVFDYVVFEILFPAGKDLFVDATVAGIERKFYGEARGGGRRGYSRGGHGRMDYNRISSGSVLRNDPRNSVREDPRMSRRARATHDFGEIVLSSRVEANEVIDALFEIVSKYGEATVADLYDLVGEQSTFADNKWGWSDMRGSDATRVRDGYLLNLPRPEPID